MVIYGYLMVTRADRSGRARAGPHGTGVDGRGRPSSGQPVDGFVYIALQELATRIAHRNTGALLGDPVGYDVMKRVAADENLHHLFYRDLAAAAFEHRPVDDGASRSSAGRRSSRCPVPASPTSLATRRASPRPGSTTCTIHHDQILVPVVMRQWDAANISGLNGDGAAAQERLMKRLATSAKVAKRFADKRDAALQPA